VRPRPSQASGMRIARAPDAHLASLRADTMTSRGERYEHWRSQASPIPCLKCDIT
jgi:hypothetical protein